MAHFFFQAEDGIRDVERSRGLGDVYKRQTFDPAFDLVFAYVSMCLLSLTTIGPACPTTWRPPNRGELVFCSGVLCMPFGIYRRRFRPLRFRSGCRTVVILCLRVCLVCAFLLAITTDSVRLPSFRRPNRDDIVSFGFVQRYPPFCHRRFRLPPFIQAVES